MLKAAFKAGETIAKAKKTKAGKDIIEAIDSSHKLYKKVKTEAEKKKREKEKMRIPTAGKRSPRYVEDDGDED